MGYLLYDLLNRVALVEALNPVPLAPRVKANPLLAIAIVPDWVNIYTARHFDQIVLDGIKEYDTMKEARK